MSKGSNRRPTDGAKFAANYDAIFRKPKHVPIPPYNLSEADEIKAADILSRNFNTSDPRHIESMCQLKDAELLRDNYCGSLSNPLDKRD